MKGVWLTFLSFFVLLSLEASLYGQQIRGSIVGNVTDASGAAVPGAHITVRNEGTGIESETATGAAGTYTVPDLLAGTYRVSVSKEGFKTDDFTDIRLLTGQTVRQDAALAVGAIAQTVEVKAVPQLVQTDSPTVGGTLGTHDISNLPTATTSPDRLLDLVPGMSTALPNGNGNPVLGGAPYIGSSNFTVNGVSNMNPGTGGGGNITYIGSSEMIALVNLPSIDTMQEFKVDASVNSAEYRGQVSVAMVTKQGSNQFHGEAYEFNENKALSANYFDLNAVGINENPFNRNQFGANVGGPIRRDKLFFFISYDGIRETHPSPDNMLIPSMAMRQGDFSASCDAYTNGVCSETNPNNPNVQLYDPLTGKPFLNNQIPASMITPQAKTLTAFLPPPTIASSPGLPNQAQPNWYGATPLRFGTNNEQIRLDYQAGTKDSIVAFFNGSKGYPWFYGYAGPANYGNWSDHGYNDLNFAGTETHTFTPGIVNEFRLGWVFGMRDKIGQNLGFQPWQLFPGMPAAATGGLPNISVSGYSGTNTGGLLSDVGNSREKINNVDVVDNLTMVRGRHTFKVGAEESGFKDAGGLFGGPPLGNLSFSGAWTGGQGWPGIAGTSPGNGFADFLLGFPSSTGYGFNPYPDETSRYWEWYAQDTWKVAPRLTLDFGVRYSYQRPWTYEAHNISFFDFADGKLVLPENSSTPTLPPGGNAARFAAYPFETTQQIGAPLNFFHSDKNNWAPRFGFAFRPFSDNKTVIRGGWGVYYSFWAAYYGPRNLASNPPWGESASFYTALPGSPTTPYLPDLTFANAFPSNLAGGVAGNPSVAAVDPNSQLPRTQQWNLTAERQVGESWSLRASYIGSQTHHLNSPDGIDANWPAAQQPNVELQQQRPLQPWSTITYYTPAGTADFNQLQLEVQKRVAQGLSMRAEYDWTRGLDNLGWYSRQNPLDLRAEYSNTYFQFRHRFLTYYVYALPVGRGRKWLGHSNAVVDGVLGGWQVSGITTYHSGDVLSPILENPGTLIGWLASYPDRVAGVPLYAGRQSGHNTGPGGGVQWFNPNAFSVPQPYTYGNASPRSIFGPGFGNWDLSVMKSFRLPHGESKRLEFKADFFNLPNHYNLGDPNTGIPDTRDNGPADPTAGRIYYGIGTPRLIQLGLRLLF
ncbi:MAG TPA: TonB-dependent receptor [Terriglobia bacterium]|nr:TonB-dependent receptor [Terriglobia bacterium]